MVPVRPLVSLLLLAACASPPPAPLPPGYGSPQVGRAGGIAQPSPASVVPLPSDNPQNYNDPHSGGAGMVPLDAGGMTYHW